MIRNLHRTVEAAVLLLSLTIAAGAQPAIFWASDPVWPGEAVLVTGDGLAQARVTVARVPDNASAANASTGLVGTPVATVQAGNDSLKFALPDILKQGLFTFEVTTATGQATHLLNQPTLWWAQAEGTIAVSPGGKLRIFGKNLSNTANLPVTVLLRGPRSLRLKAEAIDDFAISAAIPASLPQGEYALSVHNGYGGERGWSEPITVTVKAAAPRPAKRFNILAYGADGKGQGDDTDAVKAALADIAKTGGGTLYFPRGRYKVTQMLELPTNVTLKGEGRELVNIFWPDVETPPTAQLKGTSHFGIEDLTFYCSNYSRFIVGDNDGNIVLRRVTVRTDRYRGHMTADEVDRRLQTGGGNQCPLLSFGGPNVEITDCDLYSSGMVFWLNRLQGAYLARNTFTNGRWGWYSLSGNDGVIFENNRIVGGDLMATGGGLNTLDGSNYSQHVYYARNKLTNMFGWDREAMTSDAGGGAYFGKVASAKGAVVTLAEDPTLGTKDWKGSGLYILDGKGSGQYRRVISASGREVTVEKPWQVPPDATSTVTFCAFQGQCLFIGNDFTDAGVALQFYGNALEHISAGNTSVRTAGFHNFGMMYSNGIQPNWYLQWLDNRIAEGNVYRGDHDNHRLSGEAHIGVYAFPPKSDWMTPLTLGTILRRNLLDNNAHVMLGCEWGTGFERKGRHVRDVLIENTRIANSDLGIFAYDTADGVMLRGNSFTAVKSPLGGPGIAKVFVTPSERAEALRVSLQSLVSGLGIKADPAKWPEVSAALGALSKSAAGSSDETRWQGQALRATLTQVAKLKPEGFPLTSLAETLGISVRMPWESPSHVDLQNRPAGGPSALDLIVSATLPVGDPIPLSAETEVPKAPAGWQSQPSQTVELSEKAPAKLRIPLVIPAGEWAGHDFPVTLNLKLGGEALRLKTTIMSGSGYIRKWMLLGPFPNKTGAVLDMSLFPPDDGIDLAGEYEGANGKIRWQPWENGDWINFKEMYKLPMPGVAYAVACINSPRDMPAEIRLGCSGGAALTVNGEPVWSSDRSHNAGPAQERTPIKLRAGDNVIMLKLCSIIDEWTSVCEIGPVPNGPNLTGVTVIPPSQFKGRACFVPPAKQTGTVDGEIKYPAVVDWQLVYADNFDRPNLGARWRIGSGQWKIAGDTLQASGVAFLSYAEPLPAPVRIEYDTRVPGAVGGDLAANWLKKPDDYNSGYLIGFGSNGNTVNKVVVNGDQVAEAPGPLVRPGRWHHVIAQILANGRVQLIVDGQLSVDYAGKAPGEAKHPGLWAWGSDGIFARVRIYTGKAQ